ncbi:MAG: SOS response-associated peptidase [Candidatus Sumerlaeaceae bacterium]|nr:SOS response-associated peptidase [Candidatus Sumerlaeaceae bacterium]
MCGRFALTTTAADLKEFLDTEEIPDLAPRYNIAPTQPVLIIRLRESAPSREAAHVVWGLIPPWAPDPSIGNRLINARADSAAAKPAFRHAMKRRRCLIPADGFYEWAARPGRTKQPYLIRRRDGAPFAFAGLWETWHGPNGEEIESCTILTTEPNDLLKPIHSRMPVILPREAHGQWLDTAGHSPERIQSLLQPCPAEGWEAVAISTRINSPANDDPQCQQPMSPGDLFG